MPRGHSAFLLTETQRAARSPVPKSLVSRDLPFTTRVPAQTSDLIANCHLRDLAPPAATVHRRSASSISKSVFILTDLTLVPLVHSAYLETRGFAGCYCLTLCDEFPWGQVAQGAVGTRAVVIDPPRFNAPPGVCQIDELMHVQTLVP